MSGRPDRDPEAEELRRVTARAIRRLDLLEYVVVGAAAILALVAGALAAFLLDAVLGWPFRPTWFAASVVLFAAPALGVWLRHRREDRAEAPPLPAPDEADEAVGAGGRDPGGNDRIS